MKDERKTKKQLIEELEEQRRRAAESVEAEAAQTHQATLQQALRRIQEETLQMREADDIDEVLAVTRECMGKLGIPFHACGINVITQAPDGTPRVSCHSMVREGGSFGGTTEGTPGARLMLEVHQSGRPAYRRDLDEEDVYGERRGHPTRFGPLRSVLDVPFSHGTLAVNSLEPNAFSERDVADLEALAEAISLAYTRYLDFQRLEEQNRNLEVEQALERVRTQVATMQVTDDLDKVRDVVDRELKLLGVPCQDVGLNIMDEASQSWRFRGEWQPIPLFLDYMQTYWSHWCQRRTWHRQFTAADAERVIPQLVEHGRFRSEDEARKNWDLPVGTWIVDAPFAHGMLAMSHPSSDPFSDDHVSLLERFTEVFALGYTRYLDLQAAEERAAQATREAAYERVRSAVLAARSTEDIVAAAMLMEQELRDMGVHLSACTINLIDEESGRFQVLGVLPGDNASLEDPHLAELVAHWRRSEVWMRAPTTEVQDPRRLKSEWREVSEQIRVIVDVPFTYGTLAMNSAEVDEFSQEEIDILQGFAEVISLAYTRYLDFEKLEEQNRKLEIEQILERVRGQALGMHRSEDLTAVGATVFRELHTLGLSVWRCGFGIFNDQRDSPEMELWFTTAKGDAVRTGGTATVDEGAHPISRGIYLAWKRGEEHHRYDLGGDELKGFIDNLIEEDGLSLPEWRERQQESLPGRLSFNHFYFPHGSLYVAVFEPLPEDILSVLKQLAVIFGVAYNRFLELRQAEEHARQAERRAAVDRVRAEIATMRTSADLEHVTPLIWKELADAGVSFFRCGVFIATEEGRRVQSYLANPQGESLAVLDLAADSHPLLVQVVEGWRAEQVYFEQWDQATFLEWMDFLQAQGQSVERGRYQDAGQPPESLSLSFVPFAQGMLYVGSPAPLPEEDLSLVQEVATAFSVAYARYLDFEQLEEQNREIQENTRNKSEFLSRMSHDLRTPMNAIIGYTRILLRRLKGCVEERQYGNLENIQTSADNLLILINEILDLSRIEAGRIDLKPEPVDLGELVGECITSVAPLAKPGVELLQELGDVPTINTEPDRFRRVVMNLLGNAVKFTEQGSITVTLRPADSGVELSVADTGVGIPAEDLPHIFEEFRQVERQVGDKTEGTGLGLAIAAKSVEMLGGTISAESEVGRGTTFTVQIGDYAEGTRA
ncbi:ATP-binding protein [Candidatus Latescibacterota bacterium]